MTTWNTARKPTKYPGILRTKRGYRVRVRAVDSRTGTQKEVNRELKGISLEKALMKQSELREEIRRGSTAPSG